MRSNQEDATTVFLSVARPGTFKTACGKGYFECSPGEPSQVKLRGGELCLTFYASSDFLYIWDPPSQMLKQIQMSD
jgi:hypothetical protein